MTTTRHALRVLHTADWHLGARLGPHDRLADQAEPCAELVRLVERERVDLVLHAGDLFDQAQPPHAAVRLGAETLRAMNETGAAVVVVAGNHDSAALFHGLDTLCRKSAKGSTTGAEIRGGETRLIAEPDQLHVLARDGQTPQAIVECLPYMSAARAGDWLRARGIGVPTGYAERVRTVAVQAAAAHRPTERADATPRLLCAHICVAGCTPSGSERKATVSPEAQIEVGDIATAAAYHAYGHIHDPQPAGPRKQPGGYAGSLVPLGFDESQTKTAALLHIENGRLAGIDTHVIESAAALIDFDGRNDEFDAACAAGAWNGRLVSARVRSAERIHDLAERLVAASPEARVCRLINVVDNDPTGPLLSVGDDVADEPPIEDLYRGWRETRLGEEREPDDRAVELFSEALRNVEAPGTSDFGIGALEAGTDRLLARLGARPETRPGA